MDALQNYDIFVEARNDGVSDELLLQKSSDGKYTDGLVLKRKFR